eukprot:scpid97116/ scgid22551/ 
MLVVQHHPRSQTASFLPWIAAEIEQLRFRCSQLFSPHHPDSIAHTVTADFHSSSECYVPTPTRPNKLLSSSMALNRIPTSEREKLMCVLCDLSPWSGSVWSRLKDEQKNSSLRSSQAQSS